MNEITKNIIKEINKNKDRTFLLIQRDLKPKANGIKGRHCEKSEKVLVSLYTPVVEQRKNISRSFALFNFEGPFE